MEDRLLARIGPTGGGDVRAACKKCGYPGHLTYQCRNFVKVSPIYSEGQKCFLCIWHCNNLCFACLHVSRCNILKYPIVIVRYLLILSTELHCF